MNNRRPVSRSGGFIFISSISIALCARNRFQTIRQMVDVSPVDCHAFHTASVVRTVRPARTKIQTSSRFHPQLRGKFVPKAVRFRDVPLLFQPHAFKHGRIRIEFHGVRFLVSCGYVFRVGESFAEMKASPPLERVIKLCIVVSDEEKEAAGLFFDRR
ncbi:MAG: hypothetical protein LIQ31_12385 [Planctomycetes bacterium]|nr:hypothetical protein [Planctomycetota bacterium]